ncbi:MAG: hypothetical protein R3A52_20850 [Polyangiales bacterium]
MSSAAARPPSEVAVTLAGCAVIALAALATSPLRASLSRRYDANRAPLDEASIPKVNVARVISLGHTEWFADLLWVNGTIYYGESLFARTEGRYLARYGEVMTSLDPSFRLPYLWAALALTYHTTDRTREDIERAVGFLDAGARRFPNDGELQYQLGFALAVELASRYPVQSPERARIVARGAEHLRRASLAGAGPEWLSLTAARYLAMSGRGAEAIEVLRDSLVRVDNPGYRAAIEQRLDGMLRANGAADPMLPLIREAEAARRRSSPTCRRRCTCSSRRAR